jgi:two-component sensor histidine kinase
MSDKSYPPPGYLAADPWLLVEEITHRVANDYAAAIGSLSRAAARCSGLDVRTALVGAAARLRDHADLHRALLPPAADRADLSQYLRRLCGAVVRARLAERAIQLTLVETPIEIDAQHCWRVGLIVSELIANAARHGFRRRGGGIVVELSAAEGGVQCVVRDDGSSTAPTPGRGTRITLALARELGGRIDWHFGPGGTTAVLYFPLGERACKLAA